MLNINITGFIIVFSLLFVLYTYFGYPVLLWVWVRCRKKTPSPVFIYPEVSVLIAAYNEEGCICRTIQSILDSDYPHNSLKVVVVSDSSTDRTDELVSSFDANRVVLVRLNKRSGKKFALTTGLNHVVSEILVLTDASSIFQPETIKNLLRHFSDKRIGSCVGSKRILKTESSVSQGDGLYWKYDSLLRYLESRTGSSWVGCEGGIYAIRKNLFRRDFSDRIAEDFAVCCRIFEQGYTNRYDPAVVIHELASREMQIEFRRKIRVIVRGILAFFAFGYLLNPVRSPSFFMQNISHRLFRWLVPFFLIALFISCLINHHPAARLLFFAQLLFYGAAMLSAVLKYFRVKPSMFTSVPLYFTTVNLAALTAWFILFKRFDKWKPTLREG